MDVKHSLNPNADGSLDLSPAPAENSYGEFPFAACVEIAKIMNVDLVDSQTGEVYVKRNPAVAARDSILLGAYNATQGQGAVEWLLFLAMVALVVICALALAGNPIAMAIRDWAIQG